MVGPSRQDGGAQDAPGGDDADPPYPPGPPLLERELGGNLPCVVCRYNLKGVSIRSVCPECGTAVRATILALVDPHAQELTPIRHPRLVAVGLMLWSVGGLVATLLGWVAQSLMLRTSGRREVAVWAAAFAAVSGLGALGLVRPHRGVPAWNLIGACIGVSAYVPVVWLVFIAGWLNWGWGEEREALWLGLAFWMLVPVILLGLRANARLLVARSLVLRTGRTDRQTILAMAVAALVCATGIAVNLVALGTRGGLADVARLTGTVMVLLGSSLVTLGTAGAVVDSWRIARAIIAPAPSLKEVIQGGRVRQSGGGQAGGRGGGSSA